MQGMTPDFIVEQFIVLSSSYSDNPPLRVVITRHGYNQTQPWNNAKYTINLVYSIFTL